MELYFLHNQITNPLTSQFVYIHFLTVTFAFLFHIKSYAHVTVRFWILSIEHLEDAKLQSTNLII